MNLAARCTACATVFRVVQDQLRVSDGWVRCGRCGEIFNAIENLVDVDVDVDVDVGVDVDGAPAAAHADAHPAPADQRAEEPSPSRRANGVEMADAPTTGGDDTAAGWNATNIPSRQGLGASPSMVAVRDRTGVAPASPTPAPRFVRQADRAARWHRPRVRAALAAAALALGMALVLQVLIEFRSSVAARWTASQPLVEALCGIAGCSVGAARWIEVLAVDSSGLVRIDGTALYRLSVALKNSSTVAVRMPALDLSLTDGQGSLMARRVIGANEIGVQQQTLAPRAEVLLQATLAATDRPVAGYTIEIFYP